MKKSKVKTLSALFACAAFVSLSFAEETFLLESEEFLFPADWMTAGAGMGAYGYKLIAAGENKGTPTTVFEAAGGKYFVWLSAVDYARQSPGTRLVGVNVNGRALPDRGGKHGKEGLYWEKLGSCELHEGKNMAQLVSATAFGRCDALIFTQDESFDPNKSARTPAQRGAIYRAPLDLELDYEYNFPKVDGLKAAPGGRKVGLQNDFLRVLFTEKRDPQKRPAYERSVEIKKDGKWRPIEPFAGEALFLGFDEDPRYSDRDIFVSWSGRFAQAHVELNSETHSFSSSSASNPYAIGEASALLRPLKVERVDDKTLRLEYPAGVRGVLTLDGQKLRLDLECEVKKPGFYSFSLLAFNPVEREKVKAVELPTIYQMKRFMASPKMVGIRFASQPLSMVNYMEDGLEITNFVAANPEFLPHDEWTGPDNSRYGFSIANPQNRVQPAVFQPILGGPGSKKEAGETLRASFYIVTVDGDWKDSLEFANENIFDGSRLREPYDASLSEAAANIAEYLGNAKVSGWNERLKGRYNIEGAHTATTASPLSELEAALLTDDEQYYKNFALPVIEYTLSRRGPHFTNAVDIERNMGHSNTKLGLPNTMWSADYYASLNALLGGGNPWVKDLYYLKDGRLHSATNHEWTVWLGLHLADEDPEFLEKAKQKADAWLKPTFQNSSHAEPNMVNFINVSMYPNWWYLVDMYERTNDAKYLDYAKEGAFHTLSSLWAHPTPPKEEVTIHKGGMVDGFGGVWYLDFERYRMGAEENDAKKERLIADGKFTKQQLVNKFFVPEKRVDGMKVSRIGSGIEQYTTLISETHTNNIMMPSWSPEMLKVSQYTGNDIIFKYSRHSIVGRYSNFLGYYIKDFTDIQHDPEYPYKGPDISSFYFHHAPCHFGQTVDYLMAQIEKRTQNKIKFPHVRQQGYVWFTDRIFGRPGSVFGDENARPLLSKSAVRADTPKASSLLAKSPKALWVILLNDSGEDIETSLSFDKNSQHFKGVDFSAPVELYDASGNRLEQSYSFDGEKRVKIPALGLAALKMPASGYVPFAAQKPIEGAGMVVREKLSASFGDLYAFRIRGPFGKDSLFVYLSEGYLKEGMKAKLRLLSPEKKTLETDSFPFEFSVYPIDQGAEIAFEVEVIEADGKAASSGEIKLGK